MDSEIGKPPGSLSRQIKQDDLGDSERLLWEDTHASPEL
jgi:hypothetical protein